MGPSLDVGFADDKVKMKSLAQAVIQQDWCPYKRGKFEHRDDTWTGREPHAKIQANEHKIASKPPGVRGRARRRPSLTALTRTQPRRLLERGLPASRTVRQ